MPKFEITKSIYCNLVIDCKEIQEAQNWSEKIVAAVENEQGEIIGSSNFESFEAEAILTESYINLIDE